MVSLIELVVFTVILATFGYYWKDNIVETFLNQYHLTAPILITQNTSQEVKPVIATYDQNDFYNQVALYLSDYIPMELNPNQGGTLQNLAAIEKEKVDLAIVQEDLYMDAFLGHELFLDKPYKNMRFIAGLYHEVFILITYPESGINSWSDLKGKVLGFPSQKSGSFQNGFRLAQTVGLIPGKDFKYINVESMNRLANLFLERKLDAIYLTTSNKNPYIINLAQRMSLKFIGTKEIDYDILKKYFPNAREKYINTNNFYTNINTSSFVKSLSTRAILVAHSSLDSDYVYKLTRTLYQKVEKLKLLINSYLYNRDKLNLVLDSFIPIEMSYMDINLKYHPGAEKYYYEFGYITNNPNPDCRRYVGQNLFKCPEIQA